MRALSSKLEDIIVLERSRKKCLTATLDNLTQVRNDLKETMDEVLLENAVMLGRLKESRLEAQACRQEIVEAFARFEPLLGKTAVSKLVNENMEVDPIVATKKRKNKKKKKKRVTIVDPRGNGAATAM